jgi:transposase-like protein
MTQYQVTLNEQTLQRLFTSDHQLAQLLESILNQVLEAQVSEQVQAQRYERTDERQGDRNGSRARQLTTRVGTLTLRVLAGCARAASLPISSRATSAANKLSSSP